MSSSAIPSPFLSASNVRTMQAILLPRGNSQGVIDRKPLAAKRSVIRTISRVMPKPSCRMTTPGHGPVPVGAAEYAGTGPAGAGYVVLVFDMADIVVHTALRRRTLPICLTWWSNLYLRPMPDGTVDLTARADLHHPCGQSAVVPAP